MNTTTLTKSQTTPFLHCVLNFKAFFQYEERGWSFFTLTSDMFRARKHLRQYLISTYTLNIAEQVIQLPVISLFK